MLLILSSPGGNVFRCNGLEEFISVAEDVIKRH